MYGTEDVKKVLSVIANVMRENEIELSKLDAAMGDGDLGVYMKQGFEKAYERVCDMEGTPGSLLIAAGSCIMEEAPSTLGTLMGVFVRRMGRSFGDAQEFAISDFLESYKAGFEEIKRRGKAQVGEKTILDVLHPTIIAMEKAIEEKKTSRQIILLGYEAAREGVDFATKLKAIHGRPAYFGEQTIGMKDGGATVGMLLMQSVCKAYDLI